MNTYDSSAAANETGKIFLALSAGMAAAAEGQKEPRKEKVESPGAP